MARYVLDINSNDELPAVIKKCNTNFKLLASQQQLEAVAVQDDVSQILSGVVSDLTAMIEDETAARQLAYDDFENAIETIDGRFANYALVEDIPVLEPISNSEIDTIAV